MSIVRQCLINTMIQAALSLDDGMSLLKILPCEWNVQFHARINRFKIFFKMIFVEFVY
jgi:hypothetical protein